MSVAEAAVNSIICGDCAQELRNLPSNSVDLVLTSPPYFQQMAYDCGEGIGNEKDIDEYIFNIIQIFRQCTRIVKPTGTIVFNISDKYINGNLQLVPYRFVIEVQNLKLVKLVNELTRVKLNFAPKQDPRKLISSTEPFFIFAKANDYYFNRDVFLEYKGRYYNGNKKTPGSDLGKNTMS